MKNNTFVIGLVGETGSGKDTVAAYLRDTYGAELTRFSDPIKKSLRLFFDNPSKADQAWLYLAFKERFGEDVLHKALARHIAQSTSDLIVVNGLRMPVDETFVHNIPGSIIIYVTADQKLRWERTTARYEKSDDNQTLEAFKHFEETTETERHVPAIGARADVTIHNDSTLEDLLSAVDAVMREHGRSKVSEE